MKRKNELNDIYKEATQNAEFCKSVERSANEAEALALAYENAPDKSVGVNALIGMHGSEPILWDMSKQNVLASCDSGYGVYSHGHNLPIMSIREHYCAQEVGYYVFVGDGTVWNARYDEHCVACCELYNENQDRKEYDEVVRKLYMLMKEREKMSDDDLKNQKHIELFFFVFNVPSAYDFYVRNKREFDEIIKAVFVDGNRLKIGLYLSGRPNLFDMSPTRDMFWAYRKSFDAKLIGVCRSKLSSVLLTGSDVAYYDKYRFVSPLMPRLPAVFIHGDIIENLKFPNTWQTNRE